MLETALLAVIVLIVLCLAAAPFAWERGAWPYERAGTLRERLFERRDLALRALKDLDFEHAALKLSDEDHRAARERVMAQAREVFERLDALDRVEREVQAQVEAMKADL